MGSIPAQTRLPGSRPGVLLFCVGLLAGCVTVGPDFEEPEVSWLADWQTDLYGQAGASAQQTAADLSFWWQLFNDPVLSQLIETARKENLNLRIAGLRILESRAALGIARSTRYPQVQQVTGSAGYVDQQEHGGAAPNDTDLVTYQTGFNLGWELDFWGRFRRSIESADAAFFASMANYQDAQVLLSAAVADLYYGLITTRRRLEITRRNAQIQKRSLEITEELFKGGQQSELDVQQARTQYLATYSGIPELEITETNLRNALAVLLGRRPGDLPELAGVPEELPKVPGLGIDGIPAELITRRPDVRAAAWQVAAQSARIGVARADYFPAISLLGTLSFSGDSLDATPDVSTVAVGPALTWNVLDYGRIGNNVRVQDARLEQAVASYQNSVVLAAREIDDAAIAVVKTAERESALAESVRSAERALDLANVRYQEGYSDFQRVLDAQRALFAAAERQLLNEGSHVAAIVEFYRALGGGWLQVPVEALVPEAVRDRMKSRTRWGGLLDAPLPDSSEGPVAPEEAGSP
jgi:NodT family efflux transporter outer membrane factor (OMF) lipoprotein